MRAVTVYRYGPPAVLRLEEIERPAPEPNQVLVRVVAATATRTDCGLRGAEYFVGRLFTGLLRPKRRLPRALSCGAAPHRRWAERMAISAGGRPSDVSGGMT